MHLYPSDGAASRVAADATPWAYRDAKWTARVSAGVDPDPANADAIRAWTIDYFEALHPYSMGGSYVNFMMEEGQERVQATYGSELRATRRDQGEVRPGERLPREPEHQAGVASSRRRGANERPAAQLQLEPGHALHAEPVAGRRRARARAARTRSARQRMTRPGASTNARASPSCGDVAAAVAAPARARELEREHLAQHSGGGVSVQFLHVHLPVGPNRSVLTRSGACPSSTSADATDSTNDVGPQTKIRGSCTGAKPASRSRSTSTRPRANAVALLARERQDDVAAERSRAHRGRSRRRAFSPSRSGGRGRPPDARATSTAAARRPSRRRRAATGRRRPASHAK